MKVLVCESDLIWSSKVRSRLEQLGHTPILLMRDADSLPEFEGAVIGLRSQFALGELIPRLLNVTPKVIAHVGHVEKDLIAEARNLGCTQVVTNGGLLAELEAFFGK